MVQKGHKPLPSNRRAFLFCVVLLTWLLSAGNAPALDIRRPLVGAWGETALMIDIENMDDASISGVIVQTWVDATRQRVSGQAKFMGVRKGPDFEIFLFPSRLVTLPFAFYAHLDASGLTLSTSAQDDAWTVTGLKDGNQAIYESMLATLPPVQLVLPFVKAPPQSTDSETLQNAPIDGEGCQCGAEKKTRVAAETADFAVRVDRSMAELNDYVLGMEASQTEMNARARALNSPPARRLFVTTFDDAALLPARLRMTLQSVRAFDSVLRERRERQIARLDALEASCRQRDLSPAEAMTTEAKLWFRSCDRVARASRFLDGWTGHFE
ncbi:hypothetical protein QFZ88_005384 [Mesorhizobium sp. YL-MeA3-2017]|uniref:hypothetical protein n=1 Tax=Mesorhizobium sp. YL-MeA3-2017 TaxID=3042284 RepID=UPI0015C8041D|nr:hypothetical protein [Mesorhizobium sp. YL-MeA3-2017]MDQ0333002.1 hypothetical protein [Mesorhizobium sp. YL-MeA3-2017]